ncbi:Golgin imh1 [Knufia peltigerae]|uniref:Golgin imh1 n=1 Tax=Knufia peltigerae TaxID=1002370 RepID=A0AA38XHR3_9EURO|nr:Golgin imh1 [Knufia peltigerae]
MFQRLKGAIDRGIAEEQARQRQVATAVQPTRNSQRRRPQAQNGTAQRSGSKQRNPNDGPPEKGPDPSQFEADFTIGDDESAEPSRVGTPKPEMRKEEVQQAEGEAVAAATRDDEPQAEQGAGELATQHSEGSQPDTNGRAPSPLRPQELPTEVRVKLRKLDRMEAKYTELLKAYKMAHSRIQAVDSFEASLRENTPLTSINDPGALVEYLNQINLKSDMVLDELKRVTTDRDEYKKKFQASEEETAKMRTEITELKTTATAESHRQEGSTESEKPVPITTLSTIDTASSKANAESDHGAKSPASTSSRIASFSLFSPRSKAASPPPRDTSEDMFSYESEHSRLESELQDRQGEVADLKKQVTNLQNDLKVARESTESMVQSLETATRELHTLREAKDKFDETKSELQKKLDEFESKAASETGTSESLQTEINQLQAQKDEASKRIEQVEAQIRDLETTNAALNEQIQSSKKDVNILNEKLAQKDAVVKDLEDTLATYKSAERQEASQNKNTKAAEKKLATMQGIMESLRSQLGNAETTVAELKSELQKNQEDFSKRPSTKVFGFLDDSSKSKLDMLQTREDVVNYLAENFDLQKPPTKQASAEVAAPSPAPSEPTTNASKKKNKKKKKGKAQAAVGEDAEPDVPVKVSENLAEVEDNTIESRRAAQIDVPKLEEEITNLKSELSAKSQTIERLSKQLKDQETLQEEIETLRDDLLHQGEEHVEARDSLKEAQKHKQELQESMDKLEKELLEARKAAATGVDSEKAHKEISQQFDELKGRCSSLEKDLAASEQLAAARFKDITDLKDLLSKAQPELRALRNEVAELRSAKDDLKNKAGELKRLEARHEDIKAELKGLSKRLGDKDSEIRELQQKVEQETNGRTKLEKAMEKTEAELRSAEHQRQEAAALSDGLNKDLSKAKEESTTLRAKLRVLEEQLSDHGREVTGLKEELSLKTALHSSAQSLVQSLRDQTHELNMQAREASTRADNLEEELAEAQRMLSERTREGQTMRMLLDQAESGTESRIREMKERMDAAIEERDRVEDEASVSSRRMMREVEDARSKVRDAQRALKVVENEKEELEIRQRDWKRRIDELEQTSSRASKEVEELRAAMTGLREALDESERQVRELDGQKLDLRKMVDESRERVEKLTKANKNLTEELKAAQQQTGGGAKGLRASNRVGTGLESGVQSSRTSIDSSSARSPAPKERMLSTSTSRSETPSGGGGGMSQGTVDYVYLKNVLLQFLEQKDKGHQRQLIPVLGMLLHFDRKDEQKWVAAISAR